MLWAFAKSGFELPVIFHALGRQVVNKAEFFKPQELSMAVWAHARAGIKSRTLLMTVEHETAEKIAYFKPQELANVLWGLAKLSFSAPELFGAAEGVLLASAGCLNPADVAMATWAFAATGTGSPRLFSALAKRAASLAGELSPSEAGTVLWACARAGVQPEPHLATLESAMDGRGAQPLTPRALATALWVQGSTGRRSRRTSVYLSRAAAQSDALGTKDLSMVLNACAKLGVRRKQILETLSARCIELLERFEPAELANVLWAYASLKAFPRGLFLEAVPATAEAVPHMEPQSLAMTAWAFGRYVKHNRKEGSTDLSPVFSALGAAAVEGASDMSMQGLVMTAEGFAKNRCNYPELFAAIELQVVQRPARQLTLQGQIRLLSSFALVGDQGVVIFKCLAPRLAAQVADMTPKTMANALYAFASAGQFSREFFAAAEKRALTLLPAFRAVDASTVLWAFASQNYANPDCFRAFVPTLKALARRLTSQDIARVSWAYSRVDIGAETQEVYLLLAGAASSLKRPMPLRRLTQVVRAYASVSLDCSDTPHPLEALHRAAISSAEKASPGTAANVPYVKDIVCLYSEVLPDGPVKDSVLLAYAKHVKHSCFARNLSQQDAEKVSMIYERLESNKDNVVA